jgi:hypothetical protein
LIFGENHSLRTFLYLYFLNHLYFYAIHVLYVKSYNNNSYLTSWQIFGVRKIKLKKNTICCAVCFHVRNYFIILSFNRDIKGEISYLRDQAWARTICFEY